MDRVYTYFDITGGPQDLPGYSFPSVYKYTASGFYNWEEDNLPINDLEERSDVLKQYLGLDTTLTGVTLTVSAGCHKDASANGVFTTVQEALEIVPRRLRFPLLIEICDFGDLGDLEIADIHCEDGGALQIVSRQFTKTTSGSGPTFGASSYGPSAAQALYTQVCSLDLSSTMVAISSTNLAISCSAMEPWSRHARVYANISDSQLEPPSLSFAPYPRQDGISAWYNGILRWTRAYGEYDEEAVLEDVNPIKYSAPSGDLITARRNISSDDPAAVLAYGAYFRSVKITNCSRIKLQNICVDSASGADWTYPVTTQYLCDRGMDIRDSEVLLEDVAISRFNKTGLYAQDSAVSITRGFVVYRIYSQNGTDRGAAGEGIHLIDSTLAFDTQQDAHKGWEMQSISKCGVGIKAINSSIVGGAQYTTTTSFPCNAGGGAAGDTITTKVSVSNSEKGIELQNSFVNYDGRIQVFCNLDGITAVDSTLSLSQFTVEYNQNLGISLSKSVLKYGKFGNELLEGGASASTSWSGVSKPEYTCDMNGVNLKAAKGSSVFPYSDVSCLQYFGMWGGSWSGTGHSGEELWAMHSHGRVGDKTVSGGSMPAIEVIQNSNAEFSHLGYVGRSSNGGNLAGACALASDNSNIVFRGSDISKTAIGSYGAANSSDTLLYRSWTTAAVAAKNNSKVSFTGPTKIGRYGICVLAQDNSKMHFGPPSRKGDNGVPDMEYFQLSSTANHTQLDLHSQRACLVANRKSVMELNDLGGSALQPNNTTDMKALSGSDMFGLYASATSGSFVRFYPNGYTKQAADTVQFNADELALTSRTSDAISDTSAMPDATTGGMVARAIGGSEINLNMVNFACGLDSEDVSGAFYNYMGTGCEYTSASGGVAVSPTSNLCNRVNTALCCSTNIPPPPTTTTTGTTTTGTTTTSTSTTTTSQTETEGSLSTWATGTFTTDHINLFVGGMYQGSQSGAGGDGNFSIEDGFNTKCMGSKIQIWNVADNSKFHAANLLINRLDPKTECVNSNWHGPTGRWPNGAACDYYGKYGLAASTLENQDVGAPSINGFYNLGIFRLVGGHRGHLKMYGEYDYAGDTLYDQYYGGGSPMDQVGSQGYLTMFDQAFQTPNTEDATFHVGIEGGASPSAEPVFGRGLAGEPWKPGKISGLITHAMMTDGYGMLWDAGQLHPSFALPPLHLGWQGYLRNFLDQSAAYCFSNSLHAANKKINLLSIYRSTTYGLYGGEGRDAPASDYPTWGPGVRSLNLFSLDRLV